ncbi:proline-rich receptor-like protein kinase PERK2 [Phragmites australis]|uniref:proline-rich receptor-like protein kinase PERK2 n=1 Tax=Phragmites australis TaxID=29695 RepID=UPI002D79A98D|nr:proline-rich receptor-like protein kinase PERK2 [Phragmites australis]
MSAQCDTTRICDTSPPANIGFPELVSQPTPALASEPSSPTSPGPAEPSPSPVLAPPPLDSSNPSAAPPTAQNSPTRPPFQSAPEPAPAPLESSNPSAYGQLPPPDPTGPPVHRSAVGIAAGSAAAAASLLVLALGLCLVLRKRRAGRGGRAAAGSIPVISSGSSEKDPSVNVYPPKSPVAPRGPLKQQSIELSPPLTSSGSSAAHLAISRESFKSHHPRPHGEPRGQAVPGGEIHFRGEFAYGELAATTNGFAVSNLIGCGGFGDVYMGTVDGAAVAIKRLRVGSQQGDREFQAEVQIISRVHHRNLVSLVGYCVGDSGQSLLVYEFMPNMTLEYHLHGGVQTILDWPARWKIAVGAAKGLAYLHEDCHPRIIHRDIKASNILLDHDFNPKVSDFGMAKFMPGGHTHISTRIVGTIGYLAPEYASSGRLTEKSDVFSYGVVLLELITGMNAAISVHSDTDDTLVDWARPLLTRAIEHSSYDELVDPLLASFDTHRMARLVRCAAAAVRSAARRRPRMSQIVRYLEGDTSAEEIDACDDNRFSGESGSSHGDTTVQFHPVRYNEIRKGREERSACGTNVRAFTHRSQI